MMRRWEAEARSSEWQQKIPSSLNVKFKQQPFVIVLLIRFSKRGHRHAVLSKKGFNASPNSISTKLRLVRRGVAANRVKGAGPAVGHFLYFSGFRQVKKHEFHQEAEYSLSRRLIADGYILWVSCTICWWCGVFIVFMTVAVNYWAKKKRTSKTSTMLHHLMMPKWINTTAEVSSAKHENRKKNFFPQQAKTWS